MAIKTKILAASAVMLAAGFVTGTAHAQAGVYVFHSGASGTCPGLDWHVTREGGKLGGFISWDHGKSIARVDGTVANNAFNLNATEVGGSKTAKITGTISNGNMMMAQISGVPACEGKTINVPWYTSLTPEPENPAAR